MAFFFNTGCPREEGYLLIIIGVILGIVAIGAALLLIWKLLATIQVFYLHTDNPPQPKRRRLHIILFKLYM